LASTRENLHLLQGPTGQPSHPNSADLVLMNLLPRSGPPVHQDQLHLNLSPQHWAKGLTPFLCSLSSNVRLTISPHPLPQLDQLPSSTLPQPPHRSCPLSLTSHQAPHLESHNTLPHRARVRRNPQRKFLIPASKTSLRTLRPLFISKLPFSNISTTTNPRPLCTITLTHNDDRYGLVTSFLPRL